MKNKFHILPLLMTLLTMSVVLITTAMAQRFAVATGSWSGAIWATTAGGAAGSAVPPTSADAVTINAGVTVTVDGPASCASLTFTAGAPTIVTGITLSGTNSLTITGTLTINGQNGATAGSPNNLDVGAGTVSAGSVVLAGVSNSGSKFAQINISTGTVTVAGNITSDGTECRITFSGAGTLNAGGTFMSGTQGTFTASTGTVNFNGAGAQAIAPFAYTFYDVILSGSNAKTLTNATITGDLSLTGTATATQAAAMTIGNLNVGDGTTFTIGGFNFTVTGTTTVGGGVSGTLAVSSLTGTKTFGNVIINAGGAWNSTAAETYAIGGSLTMNGGTITGASTGVYNVAGNFNVAAGTNTFGVATLTVTGTTNISSIFNISSTTGTKTFNGLVTVNPGGTWNNSANEAITFHRGLTFNGTTFTAGTGIYTFNTNGQSIGGTNAISIPNVTVTGVTLTNNGTLTVSTALSSTGGLTQGTNAVLNIGGTAGITTLTATASGNTVNYYGAAQTAHVNVYNNLTLSGSNAKTFATTPTVNGVLSLEGTASVVVTTGVVTYGANATLQYNKPGVYTATAEEWITPFAASGGVVIENTGVITANAAKTFTNCPLTIMEGATLSNGGFAISSPSILTLYCGGLAAGSNISGTGLLTLGGNVSVVDAGDGTAGATVSCPVALTNATTRTFNVDDGGSTSATDLTVSNIISTTGSMTKTGAGKMVLSGVNTYSGVTTINDGVLSVGTIGNGGVAGNLGAAAVAAGNIVLGGGTLQYTGANASTNRAYTLTGNTASSIDVTTNTLTISGAAANTNGALAKIGTGTLILSGANQYTGLTTISGGMLQFGIANALSNGPVTVDGGTLNIVTFNDAVGAVALLNGAISGTSGILTGTSYDVQNGTVSAILGGGGVALTKTTAGTVTLSGPNTFSGGATLNDGTLNINNATAIGSGAFTIVGGTIDNTSGGGITLTNNNTQYWNADVSFGGSYSLNMGTGNVLPDADHVVTVGSNTLIVGGVINDNTKSLTKDGAGTLSFGGNPITLQTLSISMGTLTSTSGTMSLSGNFSNNGTFTHNSGTVTMNGTGAQSITGSSTTVFNNLTLNNSAGLSTKSIILNGILTLSSGAISIGANTLTFQNSNTPIVRTSGTITTATGSNLVFGTVGNTAGAAFVIPAGTFTAGPSIANLTINRTNSITLNNQMMSLSGTLLCNGPLITNGNLTLLSTAVQTALIDGSGSGSVSGNVTMQRYLPSAFGYKYVSSPFLSSTVNEFSNDLDLGASFPTFYKYTENMISSGWVSYTAASNVLHPLEGYAANFDSVVASKTVDVTGVVNNGPLSVTMSNNNQPYTSGFNLAGNPYPSPIDWNAGGWTKANIDDALYYFNAGSTDRYVGTYSTYINGVSSDGVANNIIPSMQGFLVHVSIGTFPVTGTLGVTNSVRTNDLTHAFLKSKTGAAQSLLRITAGFADNGTPADPAVIYFDSSATLLFEKSLDALKLMNTDKLVPNIYTVTPDDQRLSIHAVPFLSDSIEKIPLGLRTAHDGWIMIKVSAFENLPAGMCIYLVDAGAGVTQDLKLNPQYRFFLKAGDCEKRFSLVLSSTVWAGIPAEMPEEYLLSQNYPNPFNPRTTIKYFIPQAGMVRITMYDIRGREVSTLVNEEKQAGAYEVQFDGRTLSSGVYFYRLQAGKIVQTKKLTLLK